jgi:heavy metal translocating P-type ATPase
MKFTIKHEARGRMRIHLVQYRMSYAQADLLLYYLHTQPQVKEAKVYERTGDAVVVYTGDRQQIIDLLLAFAYEEVKAPAGLIENSGRALNADYQEKLIGHVVKHYAIKWLLPLPLRSCYVIWQSLKYMKEGVKTLLKGRIEVPVLDATAIAVSVLRNDTDTAGSIMFLLGFGELLEEWTHKKSIDNLARSLSLHVTKAWKKVDGTEFLVSVDEIETGEQVVVHMGNVIPFDGVVAEGEALVNQASLTGEATAVRKAEGASVYAGTVMEEGTLTITVSKVGSDSKFEKIVKMIEESEKMKSNVEGKAAHLADKLVPYSLGATALTYLLTRNATKALSILMVDFSCALKLAMPISVLSAIREAGSHHITVKGGKFLEAMAEADTIVFDKTGTLTKACPTVASVVSFCDKTSDELLRIAACLEEHFPHSMAKAVVDAATQKNLLHEEMHTKPDYVVAHGIASTIGEKRVVIGSYHFVFEDEKCMIPEEKKELFENLPLQYSHLYLAIDGKLAATICIEDPLRTEAKSVIRKLHKEGFTNIVMMTGDSYRTAEAIAKSVGVDHFYAEVLPEDKADFVQQEKAKGHKVVMIGDGINDSPALSAADVGIAISDGAEIAREIADITVSADDLNEIVILKKLSEALMKRIHKNYRQIVTFNAGLIALGVAGVIPPTTSALLHNTSTLLIGMDSMKNLL